MQMFVVLFVCLFSVLLFFCGWFGFFLFVLFGCCFVVVVVVVVVCVCFLFYFFIFLCFFFCGGR